MPGKLDGKRVAILATDGVEQVELTDPRDAVTQEGARVEIVSLSEGESSPRSGSPPTRRRRTPTPATTTP